MKRLQNAGIEARAEKDEAERSKRFTNAVAEGSPSNRSRLSSAYFARLQRSTHRAPASALSSGRVLKAVAAPGPTL